jgi:uncharacterized protein (TIGR03083 family)
MQQLTSDRALEALQHAADRFIALLRTANGEDAARAVPGMRWTVGEVAEHVLAGMRSYRVMAAGGERTWKSFATSAEDNDASIAATPERDLASVAAALPAAVAELAKLCAERGDALVPYHENTEVPATVLAGLAVGELVLHGRDIARAIKTPWPIGADEATVVIAAALTIVPHFVDESAAQGFSAIYDLRLHGGTRSTLSFVDGVLTTRAGSPDRADCHIAADPSAFVLLAYGRTSLAWPIATGKMIAWGRRPWLAFQLLPKLRNP